LKIVIRRRIAEAQLVLAEMAATQAKMDALSNRRQ
jgi:hypothetical protein